MNLKPSLFCAAFCAFCFLFQSTAFAEMVAIKGNNVNMRSGPGHKHEVLFFYGVVQLFSNVSDMDSDCATVFTVILILLDAFE